MVPVTERIQDVPMRLLPACAPFVLTVPLVIGLAGASAGCAATLGGNARGPERVVVAVDAPVSSSSEVVEVTEVVPPVAPEAPAPRRRLSQTVTLGASEPIYAAAPAPPAYGAGGPNVTVNNNVTVVNGQPSYGYGTYGYGYGRGSGFGSGGRDGRATTPNNAWAPNGWEGAQRTAAPGRTPGVGGNWAPPADHGPRQMK
jgi:hypothetical protein